MNNLLLVALFVEQVPDIFESAVSVVLALLELVERSLDIFESAVVFVEPEEVELVAPELDIFESVPIAFVVAVVAIVVLLFDGKIKERLGLDSLACSCSASVCAVIR